MSALTVIMALASVIVFTFAIYEVFGWEWVVGRKLVQKCTNLHIRRTIAEMCDEEYEDSMKFSRTAWRLPKDYFKGWRERVEIPHPGQLYPEVQHYVELGLGYPMSQSPLSRLMNATHDSIHAEVCERLWNTPEFQNIVRHVFNDIDKNGIDEMRAGAEWGISHGYWRPMANLVLAAIDRDLVGCGWSMRDLTRGTNNPERRQLLELQST